MRLSLAILSAVLLAGSAHASGAGQDFRMDKQVSIEWRDSCPHGQIRVSHGFLTRLVLVMISGNAGYLQYRGPIYGIPPLDRAAIV